MQIVITPASNDVSVIFTISSLIHQKVLIDDEIIAEVIGYDYDDDDLMLQIATADSYDTIAIPFFGIGTMEIR